MGDRFHECNRLSIRRPVHATVGTERYKPTIAHFHPEFDEIYFMLDGWIHLKTYDPATGAYAEQRIGQNELAFFPKGMHHVIREASDVNRICVLMIPGFLGEVPSDEL